ncbi:MAG: OPT/YSL family transporter [Myxococcales bacterium]|nr:OPT/YSL family transporter [Myxococcales bacterium]
MDAPSHEKPTDDAALVDKNDPEVRWLREVYQGDHARQLTPRAVIAGMLLGGVMSLSNLYIALKTGWSFGVTITAGILAYVIFGVLKKIKLVKDEFGMLENNAMQSVASAAGYMTGGGTAAAIPALMLATHMAPPWYVIFLWITSVAMMGVFMAIPMKRQMINQEGLAFPSGIAAAATLKGLHPEEAEAMERQKREAMEKYGVHDTHEGAAAVSSHESAPPDGRLAGRALLWSALVGAVFTWWREARARWLPYPNMPEHLDFPWLKIQGIPATRWTINFDTSLLLLAAGGIMGWRSAWSMLLGASLNYFFLAPYGVRIGAIAEVKYRAIVNWTVWLGSPFLLTSGLLAFAFSWRQVARAFADLAKLIGARSNSVDPLASVEVPMRWFAFGMLAFTPLVSLFGWLFFGMKLWMSLLCIAMSFFIAVVASRATGETDTTPTGALGKITQLTFGVLAPGSVPINLMSASLSAGVAIHSADLLTDLKSGYLLGARPRQQFLAQFFGVLAGSTFVVWAFRILVPDHTVIGTDRVPAPGALGWYSVARVLAGGLEQLSPSARTLIAVGATAGVVFVLLERALPQYKKYIPSAVGLGLGFTLNFSNCLSMFIGAVIALVLQRVRPKVAEDYIVPVSSGIIAGESLIGILIKVLQALHILTG